MKRTILILLAAFVFLAALGITVYPLVSNYVNDRYASEVRTDYTRKVQELDDTEIQKALVAAQAYNEGLLPLRYSKEAVQTASEEYDRMLNLNDSGIMGYVEIPQIQVKLPIYHGTGEDILQKGVGHLTGSSLPIGGEGCHCVLTGHSGVAGNRLFSDLDQLQVGDVFYLYILDQTLAYQVTEINRVLPHETDLLAPVAGKDLCTLVTCYPYGVNSHRLLIRGTRIPYEDAVIIEEQAAANEAPAKSTWKEQYYAGLAIGGGTAVVAIVVGAIILLLRRKRRCPNEK